MDKKTVAGDSADFPPTYQQVQVHEELKKELDEAKYRLQELVKNEVPAFNKLLEKYELAGLITR